MLNCQFQEPNSPISSWEFDVEFDGDGLMAQPSALNKRFLEKQFSRGQQTFPNFHAFKYFLAKPSKSGAHYNSKSCTLFLLTQGTQATRASSVQKIAFHGDGHLGRCI